MDFDTQVLLILSLVMFASTSKLPEKPCKTGDLFPHEDDYARFYLCNETVKVPVYCPHGLYFNQLSEGCDYMSENFPLKIEKLPVPIPIPVVPNLTRITRSIRQAKKIVKKHKAEDVPTRVSLKLVKKQLMLPNMKTVLRKNSGEHKSTGPRQNLVIYPEFKFRSGVTTRPNFLKYPKGSLKPVSLAQSFTQKRTTEFDAKQGPKMKFSRKQKPKSKHNMKPKLKPQTNTKLKPKLHRRRDPKRSTVHIISKSKKNTRLKF